MKNKVQINQGSSYKVGMNEVVGLEDAMRNVFKPVQRVLQDKIYWNSDLTPSSVEYKSRDGFIPHSHNCGGLEVWEVIPKCEEYDFDFLDFGECEFSDDPEYADSCGPNGSGCNCDDEGHLSASLRIWFKFEGYDKSTGELSFYLTMHGGNGDAPYFRTNHSKDYFEASFTCKSIEGLQRAASKHIKALVEVIK